MFDAREEPATELFAVERGGGAVERDVGLAVGGEEEIGFIAGDEEIIEGREFPGLCAASLHDIADWNLTGWVDAPGGLGWWLGWEVVEGDGGYELRIYFDGL